MQWDIKRRHRSVRTHSKHNTNAWTNTTKPRTALEHSQQPGCRSPSTWWSPWRCPPRRCPRTARSHWSVWPTPPSVRSDCPTTRLLISSDWDNDGSQHDIITIGLHYITLHYIAGHQTALLHTEAGGSDLPGPGLPVLTDQSEDAGGAEPGRLAVSERGEL